MSVTYYPIFSGVKDVAGTTSTWGSVSSGDFTDQTTGNSVDTGRRYQRIVATNTSSVAAMISWAKDTTTLNAQSANDGYPLAPGESQEFILYSIGASEGVQVVGAIVDPDLTTTNLGSGVNATTVAVYAEFGNT